MRTICRDGHLQCLLPHELDPVIATAQLILRTILSELKILPGTMPGM